MGRHRQARGRHQAKGRHQQATDQDLRDVLLRANVYEILVLFYASGQPPSVNIVAARFSECQQSLHNGFWVIGPRLALCDDQKFNGPCTGRVSIAQTGSNK